MPEGSLFGLGEGGGGTVQHVERVEQRIDRRGGFLGGALGQGTRRKAGEAVEGRIARAAALQPGGKAAPVALNLRRLVAHLAQARPVAQHGQGCLAPLRPERAAVGEGGFKLRLGGHIHRCGGAPLQIGLAEQAAQRGQQRLGPLQPGEDGGRTARRGGGQFAPPEILHHFTHQGRVVGHQLRIEGLAALEGALCQRALAKAVDGVDGGEIEALDGQCQQRLRPFGRDARQQLGKQGIGGCSIGRRGLASAIDSSAIDLMPFGLSLSKPSALRRAQGERKIQVRCSRLIHLLHRRPRLHQPSADAAAQLRRRRLGEGNHQNALHRQRLLQHQAQVERRDGPRLARAGAGLDGVEASEGRSDDVERFSHRECHLTARRGWTRRQQA